MNTKLAEHNSLEKYFFRRKTFPLLLLASFLIRQSPAPALAGPETQYIFPLVLGERKLVGLGEY